MGDPPSPATQSLVLNRICNQEVTHELVSDGPVELLPEWEFLIGASRRLLQSTPYRNRLITAYQVIGGSRLDIDIRIWIDDEDVTHLIEGTEFTLDQWMSSAEALVDLAENSDLVAFLVRLAGY
jgi:hypothetical protein